MRHIINPNVSAMIIRGRLLMIILFTALSAAGYSQNYFFEQYSSAEGLGSSKVYLTLQDSANYIWLGTDVGLSRFNGNTFENFNVDDGIAPGGVRAMTIDSRGRLWLGHLNGGISYYDGKEFHRVEVEGDFINSDVNGIAEHDGYLWFSLWRNGAFRADFPDEGDDLLTGKRFLGQEGLSDMVFSIYTDNDNNLFFIADLGVRQYIKEEERFEAFAPPGMSREWQFTSMLHDSRGDYWFGTHWGGLYRYISSGGEMTVYDVRDGLAGMFVTSLMEDYRGNIWVGTDGGGVSRFCDEGIVNFNTENGLPGYRIFSINQDSENNILICDFTEGLLVFKGDHIYSIDGEDELPGRSVYAVNERPDGSFWLATDGGIARYRLFDESGAVALYDKASDGREVGRTRFFVPDKRGNIWIGTDGMGISYRDAASGILHRAGEVNNLTWRRGRPDNRVMAMAVDKEDHIWVGTTDGLFRWNTDSWQGVEYRQVDGLAGNWITALWCGDDGVLWVGSENRIGLHRHIPGTDSFEVVRLGEDDYIPRTITGTEDGRVVVGTESGVFILKSGEVEMRLTENDGLVSNHVRQIIEDGNYLYIATNRGLNRYDFNTGTTALFSRRGGFVGIEAVSSATYRDSEGRLWFGSRRGATIIDPSRFHPVRDEPPIHLAEMLVNDTPKEMEEGMELSFGERSVTLRYHSISFTDPGAIRYRVMLEGLDSDWRPPTTQTTAYYPSLSPGNYTFMVKALNSDGYWNEEPVSLSFTIKPPFYATTGFRIGVIVMILAMVYLFIKMREMKLIKEKRILEDKVRERTAEVVHKSQIIEEKNRDITASITYAERIQRAMLPPDDLFPGTFVLFMPKDIVSGDFYWMHDDGDSLFIAAVDCTGHGVPGAFMSIIGNDSLNKIVREYGITKPSAILDQLNKEVVRALIQRDEEAISDGMDLSLIVYNKLSGKMEFAGAFNPLYLVREEELTVYKADRFPIGKSTDEEKKRFTNVTVDIRAGDMIYLFSDGFADQFGGELNQKYKSANVKRLLKKIAHLEPEEQKGILCNEIKSWMGDYSQVDDILFIGMRVP